MTQMQLDGGRTLVRPALFPDEVEGDWFVLHTRHKQEKILSDMLAAQGIYNWLPLVRTPRQYGRHRVTLELPLFPGYLFLRGSVEQAYEADRTSRVVSIIQVANQKLIAWELKNLYLAMMRGALPDPCQFLKRGTRVEVRSGPFQGLQGVVEGPCASGRLVLQVETLGRAVSLEIDGAILDVIG